MTKVMYIHPDSIEDRDSQCVIPIGMVGIINMLVDAGFKCKAINVPIEKKINKNYDIEIDVLKFQPNLVLIDLHWYIYSYSSIELARKIKTICNDCYVAIGGITASIFRKEIIEKYNFIDFVVGGDSEIPLLMLCKAIDSKKRNFKEIPNLAFRDKTIVILNKIANTCESFDNLNYSNYEFLKNHNILFEKQASHKDTSSTQKLAWVPIARGCNYNCSYCGGNRTMFESVFGRDALLLNSATNICNTIENLISQYKIDTFGITHDLSMINYHECYKILNRLNSFEKKVGIFNYLFQLPQLDYFKRFLNVIDHTKSIIGLPILSGDEDIRIKNGKLFSNSQAFDFLDCLCETNIKVELYFVDNLAISNQCAFKKTLEFVDELLKKYNGIMNLDVSYGFEIVQPLSYKHRTKNLSSLKNFEDYYYRYSPLYFQKANMMNNPELLVGDYEYDKELSFRIKTMKSLINLR